VTTSERARVPLSARVHWLRFPDYRAERRKQRQDDEREGNEGESATTLHKPRTSRRR
jgi:hypothetical protein